MQQKEKLQEQTEAKHTDESLKALDDAVAAVVEGLKKLSRAESMQWQQQSIMRMQHWLKKMQTTPAVNAAKEKAAGVGSKQIYR